MVKVLFAAGIVITCIFLQAITGMSIFESIEIVLQCLVKISKKIVKSKEKTDVDLKLMSSLKKRKSISYKFMKLIREMILDLGLNPMDVTAGGFLNFVFFMSTGVGILLGLLNRSFILFCLSTVGTFFIALLATYIATRTMHFNRIVSLMEAENMLCTSLNNGVVNAIKVNLDKFAPNIRQPFEIFLLETPLGIPRALDNLNLRVGSVFDDFCNQAKIFETSGGEGYIKVFEFNIKSNNQTIGLVQEAKAKSKSLIQDAVASSLVLMFALGFFSKLYPTTGEVLKTIPGIIFQIIYFSAILAIFLIIQIITNKGVDK